MTTTIRIEGLDKLLRKVDSAKLLQGAKAALRAGAVHIKGKISKYPPSSEANSPSRRRWYERGYGSRWRRKDGTIGGRKTSETLGKRWTTQARNQGLSQIIGNNASYAIWVQDEEHQAAFHKARGWNTAQDVAREEAPVVVKFIQNEIDKRLAS